MQYHKKYYAKPGVKERRREWQRNYDRTPKAKKRMAESQRKYRQNNPDKVRKTQNTYLQNKRFSDPEWHEKRKAYQREWSRKKRMLEKSIE